MNNLGIVISFIIGGLLTISILTLNARVIQNSGETVLNMTAKQPVENITEIMRHDFQRIGYNLQDDSKDAIQSFSDTKFMFWADVDDDETTEAQKITWRFNKPGNKAKYTENPNDYELVRQISGNTQKMIFPLVEFEFKYYDKNHNITNDAKEIRSIAVTLKSQSAQTYGDNTYATSVLEKTFSPPNLKLQDIDW